MHKHVNSFTPWGPRRGSAFTFIELLVVIGIIALMVTLLMPMLGRAKDLARQAKCMTNQRNIVNAVAAYVAENRYYPYNYAYYGSYAGTDERWALGCISPYLRGGSVYLRERNEGQFPADYICPSADLRTVYLYNPSDKYHACYWTNMCIRINRGWGGDFGDLFDSHGHGTQPGDDHNSISGGLARIFGRLCAGVGQHWRSLYNPEPSSVPLPEKTMFSGDTNDVAHPDPYGADPGEWMIAPGWGRVHGSLGFRHMDNNMVVSYLDGHVRPFARSELDNYSKWHDGDSTGDFLIRFTENYSCNGSGVHTLFNKVVE